MRNEFKHAVERPGATMSTSELPRRDALELGALAVKACLVGLSSNYIVVDVAKLRAWLAGIDADVLAHITSNDTLLHAALGHGDKIAEFVSTKRELLTL